MTYQFVNLVCLPTKREPRGWGGKAGPPSSKGYKYGDPTIQVGASLESGRESRGTRIREWLRWRGPAAIVNDRPQIAALFQERLADWPSVVTWLWLWLLAVESIELDQSWIEDSDQEISVAQWIWEREAINIGELSRRRFHNDLKWSFLC
jgi:hypothetical protein